jgi:uncharacterized membrane protein YdbT with pleckstrin-like domain
MEFSLRPIFIGWITLLGQLPIQIFMTIWGALFFGGMASFAFPKASPVSFIVAGGLFFFGLPLVVYVGKMLSYSRSVYRFSSDRIEIEEGFFSRDKKIILLKDVREASLHKGFLQQTCGLGSIHLATIATGSGSGIVVADIADPDAAYVRIQKLVEMNRQLAH